MMKQTLLAGAAAISFAFAGASAQDVPSGTYNLDPSHTTVVWSVSHLGISTYRGSFTDMEGSLDWDKDNPTESSLSVTIDANSVASPAAVSHAGNENFQQDIARVALGANDHPDITFTSKSLKKTGDETGVIVGDLTFNGETKEVEMDVELVGAGVMRGRPMLGFSGETTIDRTEWGAGAWTEFAIGTEVTISVEAEFHGSAE